MLKKDSSPTREAEPSKTSTIEEKSKPAEPVEEKEPEMSVQELDAKLGEIKDQANVEYKNKIYVMAIAKFTEGITLYHKHKRGKTLNKDVETKATQLYTNRALSWH